jgi:hypothetical protein
MLFHHDRSERLAKIADRLCCADRASADLICDLALEICGADANATRLSARVQKLIAAGAWTDAVLALLGGGLPQWKLRRLAYDEGQWHCALSLQRELPDWLDQAVETSHHDLCLAIFRGLIEAALREPIAPEGMPSRIVPRIRLNQPDLICCDNFA